MLHLSEKIKDLMNQKNIKALDIERATGLSRSTVYSIVKNVSKKPSADSLKLIAKALNVSLEEIIGGDNAGNSEESLSQEQLKIFESSAGDVVHTIIKEEASYSLSQLVDAVKEVYEYSTRSEPYKVDTKFTEWLVSKNKDKK